MPSLEFRNIIDCIYFRNNIHNRCTYLMRSRDWAFTNLSLQLYLLSYFFVIAKIEFLLWWNPPTIHSIDENFLSFAFVGHTKYIYSKAPRVYYLVPCKEAKLSERIQYHLPHPISSTRAWHIYFKVEISKDGIHLNFWLLSN